MGGCLSKMRCKFVPFTLLLSGFIGSAPVWCWGTYFHRWGVCRRGACRRDAKLFILLLLYVAKGNDRDNYIFTEAIETAIVLLVHKEIVLSAAALMRCYDYNTTSKRVTQEQCSRLQAGWNALARTEGRGFLAKKWRLETENDILLQHRSSSINSNTARKYWDTT